MKLKYYFLVVAACAGSLVLHSCDNEDDDSLGVSTELQNAFSARYPDVKSVKWERKSGYYVADFRESTYDASAWFTPEGIWKLTETDIPYQALPSAVQTAFESSSYAVSPWRREDVDKLERQGMETVYVIEVENGKQEIDLYYSENGVLIKEVVDKDDEDEYVPSIQPSTAIEEFIRTHYPDARIVDIEKEHGNIEVEVIDRNIKKEILFDAQEAWISTSWEVAPSSLAANILEKVNTDYPGYRIDDADYYELADGSAYYLLDLEKAGSPDIDDVRISL